MTTPNNENSLPEPDPTWDYYLTYHSLLKAKSDLQELIEFMSPFESARADIDEVINKDLNKLVTLLQYMLIPPDEAT